MKSEFSIYIIGLAVGVFTGFLTATLVHYDHTAEIKSGKQFILGKASYRCTKTNELTE